MQSLKQILGWEEGRSRFLNICFSTLIVLALFTVALGLHLEFTALDVRDGLSLMLFIIHGG
ncbi:MAG: hypothetical protein A3F84_12310 [Candidatus Handelsmanbacteria bacterium RIFCSPLOWO2_12_FULL_64_10]|uniref:Uncharacterized protein n=1 Tax=Handelsmanbacteria sp. (strain RIFCSPLOWO2_12_FULL_64_10) TaxID=1817868 RepID=A0A1F6CA19_HANXR|nr:MAG: hypothetical protein A3F84_12310 [Candidatus Handelsmanbacteria bacterium RIFCSPLOWO2_12_FULL_64_10]